MDVRQLTYFLAVVDHGGFTRAAEHLLIAQPSLSQTIKTLERELGLPLFHRVGRGVVLSEAGQNLVGPARVAIRDLDAVRSAADQLRGVRGGRLEISAMPSPSIEPLGSLLGTFTQNFPEITVNIGAAFSDDDVVTAVRTAAAEIGVLGTQRPFQAADLRVLPAAAQPLILVSPPLADGRADQRDLTADSEVTRAQLRDLRMIASPPGSLMRAFLDELRDGGIGIEIVVEAAHRSSVLPLVHGGVGHAVLPASWATTARRLGLPVSVIRPEAWLHVAYLSRRDGLTPAAAAFMQLAERELIGRTDLWDRQHVLDL